MFYCGLPRQRSVNTTAFTRLANRANFEVVDIVALFDNFFDFFGTQDVTITCGNVRLQALRTHNLKTESIGIALFDGEIHCSVGLDIGRAYMDGAVLDSFLPRKRGVDAAALAGLTRCADLEVIHVITVFHNFLDFFRAQD